MAQTDTREATDAQNGARSSNLQDSPMMAHLMQALEEGKDIGHYGRLTFVMVAQWFMDEDELVSWLTKDRDVSEDDAREMVAQVKGHGYNPPKRDKILAWQQEQDFPICPNSDDPQSCNVYSELKFPDEVYDNIGNFWEDKVEANRS